MQNIKKIIIPFLLLLSGHVSAATVSWSLTTTNATLNDVFTVDVIGTGFVNNVDGGGVNISFDQNVINILSVSIDESVWDFGGFGISNGVIDNSNGTVNGVMVNTFADVTGDFIIATIEVQAIGQGTSILALTEYGLNPWASAGTLINPDYVDAEVIVSAVPIPAAAWLFGSGLLLLTGFFKRKA